MQVQGVSRLTFHALAPALVFNVLVTSTLDAAQSSRMALFYLLVAASAAVMARLAAIPLRLDRRALSAFMLVVVCSNSGNYGLPVALLAFGREALAFASVYFVSQRDLQLHRRRAARGQRPAQRPRGAGSASSACPPFYGAMAALLTMAFGLTVAGDRDAAHRAC